MKATDAKRLKRTRGREPKTEDYCCRSDVRCFDAQGTNLGKLLTPEHLDRGGPVLRGELRPADITEMADHSTGLCQWIMRALLDEYRLLRRSGIGCGSRYGHIKTLSNENSSDWDDTRIKLTLPRYGHDRRTQPQEMYRPLQHTGCAH